MYNTFFFKRLFDIFFSFLCLLVLWPLLLMCLFVASFETESFGLFAQKRIGRHGRPFNIFKIKTMTDSCRPTSGVTISSNPRITRCGFYMRRLKLDELPQLINVLLGHMSFVGPRPDLPGFADSLQGSDRRILLLRPGITGPASIHYKNEEEILDHVDDPVAYNRDVIWPHKVSINLRYLHDLSLWLDLKIIFKTFFS